MDANFAAEALRVGDRMATEAAREAERMTAASETEKWRVAQLDRKLAPKAVCGLGLFSVTGPSTLSSLWTVHGMMEVLDVLNTGRRRRLSEKEEVRIVEESLSGPKFPPSTR